MSKFCTVVSQKRQTKFLYGALAMALFLPQLAQAAPEASAGPAAASNSMITPDTSIFEKCSIEDLNQANKLDWVNRNDYEFNKRNMTVAKAQEVEAKIKEQGERAFMMNRMNDPEIKKNYLEQVGIRLEITKIQDAVYKCIKANILKNAPEDLKRVGDQDSKRVTNALPLKAIAIQMALGNQLAALQSDVNNYGRNCYEKEPKDLAFKDDSDCRARFQRMTRAQILIFPYAQLRSDIDSFSTDDKAFDKSIKASSVYQAALEKERTGKNDDAGGAERAVSSSAKPSVN